MKPCINRVMKPIEGASCGRPYKLKGPLFVLFICTSYIFKY